jgi:hypothetical protein
MCRQISACELLDFYNSERREESLIFPTTTRIAPPRLSDASGESKTQKQAQKRRRDGGLEIRDFSLRSE